MKSLCLNCNNENPKNNMKTCCRKCADEYKTKINSSTRECLYCKISFTVRNSNKKLLCSEGCRKSWASLPENIVKRLNNVKISIKEKFNVDNVFQLDDIKNKSKKTKLEKYGDENYNNSKKQLQTIEEKFGKEYIKNFNKRISDILFKKEGVIHGLRLDKFKQKQKETVKKNME